MILLYRVAAFIFYPLIILFIYYRKFIGKEDGARIRERFGIATIKKPSGNIVWIHSVSVGEINSVIPLVKKLVENTEYKILLTSTTKTSSEIVKKYLNDRVLHQFNPVDSYISIKRFLNFWQPKILIIAESEIWPEMILASKSADTKIISINSRMSDKSFKKWNGIKSTKYVFNAINMAFISDEGSIKKFSALGVKNITRINNIKYDADMLSITKEGEAILTNLFSQNYPRSYNQAMTMEDAEVRQNQFPQESSRSYADEEHIVHKVHEYRNQVGITKFEAEIGFATPIWMAVSTHKGEEEVIMEVHDRLKKKFPNIITMIAIRHPNRLGEVLEIVKNHKIGVRSRGDKIEESEIYIIDTIGEMGLFFRISDISFIAGSISNVGGHNPIEAAKIGSAIISGDKVKNCEDIYSDFIEKNACIIIKNKEELVDSVVKILENPDYKAKLIENARKLVKTKSGNYEKIMKYIMKCKMEF